MLILLCAFLLYSPALSVPFYLDDFNGILDNYFLRDLPASLERIFTPRGFTNLTFAVNYRLSAFSLFPLHLTNIAIHAGCGCLVFLLLGHWFAQRHLPLLGALLFVAHPLQTQAVTYLVQRATSLAAFFFLLALLLHLRTRTALAAGYCRTFPSFLFPQLLAVTFFSLALLSKQNTATLPLLLIIHDRIFPQGIVRSRRQAFGDYLPYAALPLLGLWEYFASAPGGALHIPLASLSGNDPLHYLVTQFSVIWVYFRLLLLPFGQALEHNYPIVLQLMTLKSLLALCGLLAIFVLVWRRRLRRPLLAFGVAWFFLGLAIESTLIPLDPLFEHRLYLPMVGFILVLFDLLLGQLTLPQVRLFLVAAVVVAALLTWQRNQLWNDPVAFYEENQKHAPPSERVSSTLARLYRQAGRMDDARRQIEIMRQIIPPGPNPYHQEVILFYAEIGEDRQALQLVEEGVSLRPHDPETYKSGALYWQKRQQPQTARDFLLRGLAANPEDGKIYDMIGELALDQGENVRAEEAFRNSIRRGQGTVSTYRHLGEALYRLGRMKEALAQLQTALLWAPGRPDLYEGVGRIAVALGDRELLRWAAEKLATIDGESWQRLQQVIVAAGLDGK